LLGFCVCGFLMVVIPMWSLQAHVLPIKRGWMSLRRHLWLTLWLNAVIKASVIAPLASVFASKALKATAASDVGCLLYSVSFVAQHSGVLRKPLSVVPKWLLWPRQVC
jgi:hypothetical protein